MHHDVIIIGGSFSGLSAAMYIARARRSVCIVDTGSPRNRFAAHSHGFFAQDGSAPGTMLATARSPVAAYPTTTFVDGEASLDRYLRAQAGQDVRRRANGVFILVAADAVETVLGYYTLCATSVPQGDVPAAARKHVPRYPLVSATLIGRLAVSRTRQGDGLGSLLLADAVQRAYQPEPRW